ncbi:hypothetical protein N7516_008185 [Penicillium verrucosum]|uniref:uncharacterized protein n=1 Tax=Penicillium verrucosum TaxID=60171 RepID=UPI0025455D3B|nr:uncharacterized protein N7516_008185 [Penicillium verrucosum]KAJ5926412.1 hypothetical protein N7516_008185 [Penicillium verrucosum]
MRTLVKGQTKTTTLQKKTHPTNPMVLPQIQNQRKTPQTDPGANFKNYYPARTNKPSLSNRLHVYWTSHDGAATPS